MGVGVKSIMKVKVKSNLEECMNGLNKSWVARKIGAKPKQVYAWCKNEEGQAISTPSVGYVLRLQKVLGVSVEKMFEEVEEEQNG